MNKQQRKKDVSKAAPLDSLKQLNLNAAGLDIGADEVYACVAEGRAEQTVRVFKTFTCDLYALADWLTACGVDTVAMESTGVYWIPVYEILESRGVEVCLVNARHVKKFAGRKTDVLDCQWLWQLHTYGLLKGSFRPPDEIVALRGIARQRDALIRDRSRWVQRMQKALTEMNVRLTSVISDITGVTGMAIIRAILRGERDPHQLAALRNEHCAMSEADIAKSLEGNYRAEHVFALKQALAFYDFYTEQIAACDVELEARYAAFEPQVEVAEKPLKPLKRKGKKAEGNAPTFDLRTYLYQMAGVDLCQIDGIKALTAHNILSEIGVDMSPWPTVKHFTSWLCLSPYQDKSGGKTLRTGTKKTKSPANLAFRRGAYALTQSKSALGAFYRRMVARHGRAVAHKLARIVYSMLKNHTEYYDPGDDYYEVRYRERAIRSLKRKARRLGFQVVPAST